MSDIPADIFNATALAVGPWSDPRGELNSRVARAVLAERQRAATEIEALRRENQELRAERDNLLNEVSSFRSSFREQLDRPRREAE